MNQLLKRVSSWLFVWVVAVTVLHAPEVHSQVQLEINSPAVTALRKSIRERYRQLAPHYQSGAIGLTADGNIALRDASSVPMAQRGQVNSLIAAENNDRAALYREIARANGHPEWEADVRATFAQRWMERAKPGWWVQQGGQWKAK